MAVGVGAGRSIVDARWFALPVALLAAALGAAAVVSPLAALVGAGAVLFTAVALHDLAAGVALFAVITFLEALPGVAGTEDGAIKVTGLILVVSALRRSGTPFLLKEFPGVAFAAAFLAAWALASSLWAEDMSRAAGDGVRLVLDVALVFIVFAAVRHARHVRWLVWGYIGGAAAAAVVGLVNPVEDEAGRLGGGLGDPNFLAAILVTALVFSVFALTWTLQAVQRWLLGACILLFTVAIFLTQSRGGLVALAAAFAAAMVFGGPVRRHFLVLAAVVASVGLVYYAAFASSETLERLQNPGRGSGRADLWSVATGVISDHPILGVGAGNFQVVAPQYASESINLPSVHLVVDTPKVAHNTYLHILAELGIVGFLLFLTIIGFAVSCALKAARWFGRAGDHHMELFARGAIVALVGILAADFFISEQFGKQLWLLLGLGPALYGVARRTYPEGKQAAQPQQQAQPDVRRTLRPVPVGR